MTDTVDNFDRNSGELNLWWGDGCYGPSRAIWGNHLGSPIEMTVECLKCGNKITVKNGEVIRFGDPRLCEHAGVAP